MVSNVADSKGGLLPAGTFPPKGKPLSGAVRVTITDVCKSHPVYDENGKVIVNSPEIQKQIDESPRTYANCLYPDGFEREHHVLGIEDLMTKITNNLRSRNGVDEVKVTKAPAAVAKGAIIDLEV